MSQLFSWVISKPELLISVLGWLVTYWFVIRAQAKQHKNEINHEIYKELIQELDKYAGQISEFSSKVQAYKFTKSFKHMGTEKQAVKKWIDETMQVGTNLQFYKFLQKWESYEIFVQDLQKIMLIFKKENDKVFEEFQNIFLLQDPEAENNKDEKGFEARLDALWEVSANVSCYLMDFKKVLQNYFYKQYGLKALKPRATEDSKYLVLTEKGLVETTK
ncbi:hypothetical protein A2862_03305 [Candidatus Roizmanbacteria bacterium RIFCSPHIGHO2_01_FULL_38_41]|nr:MAG: hypothetical protein A2862_03305 [Candidatus Roizmanbacteria bacterium RIFCSPHIGHO2_01_FULL_38_41]OGK33126.1 MAG: hypothetical protein A3E10_00975 [Candidatus Roizmanbacteria bacterium RIFCSPHIGHO2_12_FULL_37_23]OGK45299.1 MAG: hypothetical protein A2956_02265 [Candidatus Roizmanbacteria bacterium RIFCSPLOWO2_01_FULL_37_57]